MQPTTDQDSSLTVALPILIATAALFLRLYVPLDSEFPLNDGGLFYRMILDLEANGFQVPLTTSYNASAIPFAYPPLGLYLAAFLHGICGLDLLAVLRILPPLISCLCLIPVWGIICRVQNNPVTRLYSFAVYGLSYHAYEWLVMGGGITRAPGMFFALLAILFFLRSAEFGSLSSAVVCGVACGFAFLSHPNSSLFLVISLGTLYAFRRPGPSLPHLTLIVLCASLLFAPWLLSLHARGLLHTLFQAASTGHFEAATAYRLVEVVFIGLPALPLVTNFLALLGILRAFFLRHWYILAWFVLVYLVPRLSTHYMMLPLSLLAGYGGLTLHELLSSFAQRRAEKEGRQELPSALMAPSRFLFALVVASLLSSSVVKTVHLGTTVLSEAAIAEFSNLASDTAPESQFLVITNGNVHHHHITEWFPAFSQRRSLLTPEGKEWQSSAEFYEILNLKADLFRMIDDPMHHASNDLKQVFTRANFLIVDSESRFADLEREWQPLKEFDGLTLFARKN